MVDSHSRRTSHELPRQILHQLTRRKCTMKDTSCAVFSKLKTVTTLIDSNCTWSISLSVTELQGTG